MDFESIVLSDLEKILIDADLVKSRMLIKDDIHEKFLLLKNEGIDNTEELFTILKNKKKLLQISKNTGIEENYLNILIREVKSFKQAPNKFCNCPELSMEICNSLEMQGIKNTEQLYNQIITKGYREKLAQLTGLDDETILYLTKFADLSRIRWVNHTFAYMLIEAGYNSQFEVSQADIIDMHKRINKINKDKGFYRGQIGLHDFKLTVEAAEFLQQDIEF